MGEFITEKSLARDKFYQLLNDAKAMEDIEQIYVIPKNFLRCPISAYAKVFYIVLFNYHFSVDKSLGNKQAIKDFFFMTDKRYENCVNELLGCGLLEETEAGYEIKIHMSGIDY